jgi:hypothetical protein
MSHVLLDVTECPRLYFGPDTVSVLSCNLRNTTLAFAVHVYEQTSSSCMRVSQ